jgi:predicted secreted protein
MTSMSFRRSIAVSWIAAAFVSPACAQTSASTVPPQPVVTVSASVSSTLPNDRMHASLRAEVDNADPVVAANEVNMRMAKALARAKSVKGIEAATTAYSSYQVSERNQPSRWRVAQTLSLEGSDFSALSALVSKLQGDDQLVLAGMNFSVSAAARRTGEDALTEQAIKAWQARAQNAARGFGAPAWRTGHVTIQTGDFVRPPQPVFRTGAQAAAAAAPVATEGGTSEITVTVSGDAILEPERTAR